MKSFPPEIIQAHQQAIKAQEKAYAPYSRFAVGAVIKFQGKEELISGCNVENACYPAGLCAERNALFASVAKWGKQEIEWIVIVGQTTKPIPPCGLCLQVMSEFTGQNFPLYLGNLKSLQQALTFSQLLPFPFQSTNLAQLT